MRSRILPPGIGMRTPREECLTGNDSLTVTSFHAWAIQMDDQDSCANGIDPCFPIAVPC